MTQTTLATTLTTTETTNQATLFDVLVENNKKPDTWENCLFRVREERVKREDTEEVIGGYRVLINQNTDTELSIVTTKYSPVDNIELTDYIETVFVERGITFEYGFAVSHLNGRKTIFEYILPDFKIKMRNGEEQQLRLYVRNSFDGKNAVRLEMGFFRHACSNMALVIGTKDIDYKTSHMGEANEKVKMQIVSYIEKQFQNVIAFVERLENIIFSDFEMIENFVYAEKNKIVANRYRKNIIDIYNKFYRDDMGLSLWGLYNSYTHFITHELKVNELAKMKRLLDLSSLFKILIIAMENRTAGKEYDNKLFIPAPTKELPNG